MRSCLKLGEYWGDGGGTPSVRVGELRDVRGVKGFGGDNFGGEKGLEGCFEGGGRHDDALMDDELRSF